jgi:hypothetical protein
MIQVPFVMNSFEIGTSQNYGQKVICWGADFAGEARISLRAFKKSQRRRQL